MEKALSNNSANKNIQLPVKIREGTQQVMTGALKSVHSLMQSDRALELSDDRNMLQALGSSIARLSYPEYLLLVEFANTMRQDDSFNFDTNAYALLLEAGKNKLQSPDSQSSGELASVISGLHHFKDTEDFRTDAVLMLRLAYPFGKNTINKTFDPSKPVALDPSGPFTIWMGSAEHSYKVRPSTTVEGAVSISLGTGSRGIRLEEGKSAILGRKLEKETLFNVTPRNADGRGGVHLPSALPVPNDVAEVSRAGVLVYNKGGQIFVFDRGSRSAIAIIREDADEVIVYDPNEKGDDGTEGATKSVDMFNWRLISGGK